MPVSPRYSPETIHRALGDAFFDVVTPADFPATTLRYRNRRWDAKVGLDTLDDAEWIAHFGRFEPLPGTLASAAGAALSRPSVPRRTIPISATAAAFSSRSFGMARGGLLDLGTKGSGQTPWSRRGDGRLTLKGGVREVLATAMLEALGVDTSKILLADRNRRGPARGTTSPRRRAPRCWCG